MLAQRLILVETEQHDTQAVLTHHHARDGGFLLDLDQRCKIGHIAQVRFRGNGVAFGIVLARAVLGLLITGFLGITVLALAMVRFAFAGFRGAVVLARAMVGGRLLSGRSVLCGCLGRGPALTALAVLLVTSRLTCGLLFVLICHDVLLRYVAVSFCCAFAPHIAARTRIHVYQCISMSDAVPGIEPRLIFRHHPPSLSASTAAGGIIRPAVGRHIVTSQACAPRTQCR